MVTLHPISLVTYRVEGDHRFFANALLLLTVS